MTTCAMIIRAPNSPIRNFLVNAASLARWEEVLDDLDPLDVFVSLVPLLRVCTFVPEPFESVDLDRWFLPPSRAKDLLGFGETLGECDLVWRFLSPTGNMTMRVRK